MTLRLAGNGNGRLNGSQRKQMAYYSAGENEQRENEDQDQEKNGGKSSSFFSLFSYLFLYLFSRPYLFWKYLSSR